MSPRRPMKRIGDLLPDVAKELGIGDELRIARQMATWERLVSERVPAATGKSRLLSIQPPALVVSAADPRIGLELNLRQVELLDAFAQAPEGVHLLELRVVVRPPRSGPNPPSGRPGTPR
ncbi:MAG TPA: DciA family protein [Candidatus Limnocylindria bacterium]|nr:DciA family protein [Candidatus Limnocylindria bacterium]